MPAGGNWRCIDASQAVNTSGRKVRIAGFSIHTGNGSRLAFMEKQSAEMFANLKITQYFLVCVTRVGTLIP